MVEGTAVDLSRVMFGFWAKFSCNDNDWFSSFPAINILGFFFFKRRSKKSAGEEGRKPTEPNSTQPCFPSDTFLSVVTGWPVKVISGGDVHLSGSEWPDEEYRHHLMKKKWAVTGSVLVDTLYTARKKHKLKGTEQIR